LDGVVLFDHSDGPPSDLLLNELHFVNHLLDLDHLNHLLLLSLGPIHVLLHGALLLDDAHSWAILLLLAHNDPNLRLLLLTHDSLELFHSLQLILDLLLRLGLLLKHESLSSGLKRTEHLLLPPHRLHLPLGSLPGLVLVLCMNVTVPVPVHRVRKILNRAALRTGPTGAAGSSLSLAPEGAVLVVAAAAASSRLATPFALA